MGIPTYFRSILKENNNVIDYVGEKKSHTEVDALFFDFNALIYNVFAMHKFNGENELIDLVLKELQRICNVVIQPKKLLYVAIDGTAPRAKMVQQRSRRYKSVMYDKLLKAKGKNIQWNPSNNICPGTKFMELFNEKMLYAIEKKMFHTESIYFDGSFRPGEGEHKILPYLRNMAKKNQNYKVVVFSPDNDILSLCMLSGKKHTQILRYMDIYCLDILKKRNPALQKYNEENIKKAPMIYISIDGFWKNFEKQIEGQDKENTLIDYNFLLSMVGNDFIPSLPFMKIRSGGLEIIIKIYNDIKKMDHRFKNEYLIAKNKWSVNIALFKEIVRRLSLREDAEMKKLYHFFQNGVKVNNSRDVEYKNEWEEFEAKSSHLYLFDSENPLHEEYKDDFSKINYSLPRNEWKVQFYKYFCNFTPINYNRERTKMVHNYLESLQFTLLYYNDKCPSWRWFYGYRVAPLFSDIYSVLEKHNFEMTSIRFQESIPFSPFEQLFLILPPESFHLLPTKCFSILQKYKMYFPTEFRIDAAIGLKYIYSEAILPEFECFLNLLADIRQQEKQLSLIEKKRFQNLSKIYKFTR